MRVEAYYEYLDKWYPVKKVVFDNGEVKGIVIDLTVEDSDEIIDVYLDDIKLRWIAEKDDNIIEHAGYCRDCESHIVFDDDYTDFDGCTCLNEKAWKDNRWHDTSCNHEVTGTGDEKCPFWKKEEY